MDKQILKAASFYEGESAYATSEDGFDFGAADSDSEQENEE